MYHIIGYRKNVVRRNLESSFPDKSTQELRSIEKKFYHWFCDYFMETIKLLSLSDKDALKMIEFRGLDDFNRCIEEGQSCGIMLGHYCNWEVLSCINCARKGEKPAVMGLIYHKLYNEAFDRLFITLREKHGGTCVDKRLVLRRLVQLKQEGKESVFGYILDQSPKWENIHLWLPFLNHDTGVFTGAERIVTKMNNAVFYADMERPYRGKYICTFHLLTRTPQDLPQYDLTKEAFKRLEKSIRRQPEFYLWTHNRWKRTHEEFIKRQQQSPHEKES